MKKVSLTIAVLATGLSACTTTGQNSADLAGRYWTLVEINGQPVGETTREAYLEFDNGQVSGSGGCNRLTGAYQLDQETSSIRFGAVASTRMACPSGMEVEQQLGAVLEQTDNYSLNGNVLTLNRARMAPLARFEDRQR